MSTEVRGRFSRPLRDVSGYLLYLTAPVLARLMNHKGAPDDPLRTSVEELRAEARRRPFYGAEAMAAYLSRMLLWFYVVIICLILSVPTGFVLQPRESRPWLVHLVVEYVPHACLSLSCGMLVVAGAKVTLSWIFAAQQLGRTSEQPGEDHSWRFRQIAESPWTKNLLDPPAPLLGRLLRPILTPSNGDTLVALAVASIAMVSIQAIASG